MGCDAIIGLRASPAVIRESTDLAAARLRAEEVLSREGSQYAGRRDQSTAGLRVAQVACVIGVLFAAVNAYWALGGTWLLDTIGGTLEQQGRAGATTVILALWAAVVLKLVAAGLPLLALRWPSGRGWKRTVWGLAWAEAAILVLYGVVLTTAGLLIQAGVIPTSATADHRALAWHAYLWDPWFLIWGVLVVVAMWRGRRHRNQAALHSAQSNRVRRSLRRDRPHADPRRSQPS